MLETEMESLSIYTVILNILFYSQVDCHTITPDDVIDLLGVEEDVLSHAAIVKFDCLPQPQMVRGTTFCVNLHWTKSIISCFNGIVYDIDIGDYFYIKFVGNFY